ncbi:DNA polymerase/3'-5' exonuclease PolX [bacterium]|nr:DNA polymerase/3'-5' exonuclease PolX [bacterium]
MTNQQIARILFEMALFCEMEGIPFKPQAYERAGAAIQSLDESLEEILRKGGLKALTKIPGVGKSIADHIEKLHKTGSFPEYDNYRKKIPVDVLQLRRVGGLGPKMIFTLWKKLRITNLAELEKAAREGKIRELPSFGARSEEKILKGLQFLEKSGNRRTFGSAIKVAKTLEQQVSQFPEAGRVAIAGSLRRKRETIGDMDIVVTSSSPEKIAERFVALSLVDHVYGKGNTKVNVRLRNLMDADLRIVPEESFGAAMCYFTGSKNHCVSLRERAIKRGWKLNEYGLFEGDRKIAGATEESIYESLGMQYVAPELREDSGEIEAALKKSLPDLIEYGDLKGDLQVQTDWTDGDDSIEVMADAAEKMGLEYIAITDHTKGLPMTNGSDETKLREQMKVIRRINEKFKKAKRKFRILAGAELNIMKDGTLDIADEVLAELDVVGAAVHHHFHLSREEQTARILRVMENPHVDIVFHLTARKIIKRNPIELDVDAVIAAAARTGTVLEIDASPDRLDMKDEHIRKCVEAGVKMCIDSDAHATAEFGYLDYGIDQARRGWASKKNIINTLPVEKFLRQLKQK